MNRLGRPRSASAGRPVTPKQEAIRMVRRNGRRYKPGQFRPGPDPRRHRFTREECFAGYVSAILKLDPDGRDWLVKKVFWWYCAHPERGRQAELPF